MKLFTTKQIQQLDAYTITHEPISSIQLMERASVAITDWLLQYFEKPQAVLVVAGAGNNGGDGLAVARLLANCGFEVKVLLISTGNLSADCETNLKRLKNRVR
jgi:NAD(P)H-hydrate epimerase